VSGVPSNSERDWRLHFSLDVLRILLYRLIYALFVDPVLLVMIHYEIRTKAKFNLFFMQKRVAVES